MTASGEVQHLELQMLLTHLRTHTHTNANKSGEGRKCTAVLAVASRIYGTV